MIVFKEVVGFEWDKGNINKNEKHHVQDLEAEEVFFDENKVILKDKLHSGEESRFILLGRTKKHRILCLVFTKRGKKIRIISARDINRKEVQLYEKEI